MLHADISTEYLYWFSKNIFEGVGQPIGRRYVWILENSQENQFFVFPPITYFDICTLRKRKYNFTEIMR